MKSISLVGIVGSLRKNSYNRSLMNAVKEWLPAGVTVEVLEIGNLPLYNQDMEAGNYPSEAQALKEKIKSSDGVIVVTPEYNRSIPGVLKNALDWSSRPHGTNPWTGKIAATMGATEGSIGTALAQAHLKQILGYLGARVLGQPEFYLGGVTKKLDANGVLTDEVTKQFIAKFLEAFLAEVKRNVNA